jgi:hypothetical protein
MHVARWPIAVASDDQVLLQSDLIPGLQATLEIGDWIFSHKDVLVLRHFRLRPIVSGIPLRSTPDTIFIVQNEAIGEKRLQRNRNSPQGFVWAPSGTSFSSHPPEG